MIGLDKNEGKSIPIVIKRKYKVTPVPKVTIPHPTKLAVTMVEQGPHDNAVRVDGYGGHIAPVSTQFNTVLNNYRDEFAGAFAGLANALNLPNIDLGNLKGLKSITEAINKFNPDQLIKRFEENVLGGRTLKSILDLPKNFKQDAIGTLEGLFKGTNIAGLNVGQLIREGKATYDEANKIYRAVKDGDWKSLEGIKKALDVLGNTAAQNLLKDVVDIQAVSAFLGTSLKKAAEIGNSELVKEIKDLFRKENRQVMNQAAIVSIYNAAARGDIDMLDTIFDFTDPTMIHHQRERVTKSVLVSYRIPPYYTPHQIKEYKKKLLATLNRIDTNWYKDTHNGIEVTNLSPFYQCTSDVKKILGYYDSNDREDIDFSTELLIANSYPPADMKQTIMKMYNEISYKDRPKDPRMKR